MALVAAVVGFGVWQRQQYDQELERNEQQRTALGMCKKSSKAYEKAVKEYKAALKNAKSLQECEKRSGFGYENADHVAVCSERCAESYNGRGVQC